MYLIENDHAQRNEVNERVWFCAFSHSIHVAVLLERECKRSRLLQRARLQLLVAYSHDQAPELPITHRSSRLLQYQYLNVVQVRIRKKKPSGSILISCNKLQTAWCTNLSHNYIFDCPGQASDRIDRGRQQCKDHSTTNSAFLYDNVRIEKI
jgi:hypothetical protein